MNIKRQKGFTLIELLVVVAIISLLSSIVFASLTTARAKARDAQRISAMQQIRNALYLYGADNNGSFPRINVDNIPGPGWDINPLANDDLADFLVPKYISTVPDDPSGDGPNRWFGYYMNGGDWINGGNGSNGIISTCTGHPGG